MLARWCWWANLHRLLEGMVLVLSVITPSLKAKHLGGRLQLHWPNYVSPHDNGINTPTPFNKMSVLIDNDDSRSQMLRLSTFRGEPTTSRFEWHPNHHSSADSSTLVGSDLHLVSSKFHPGHGQITRVWVHKQWQSSYVDSLSLRLQWVSQLILSSFI